MELLKGIASDRTELENIISTGNIRTVYQPIVSLLDATILGYEALSRGPLGSILEMPDRLFRVAESYNLTWELEYLCRTKAIEKAGFAIGDHKLFINVDPKVIYDEKFRKGITRDLIDKNHMDPSNIIFEITERTSIEDYKSFREVVKNYMGQGYKIAIDDTGAGYSGLRMLAEIHPQYIKIDLDLIRDIDKKSINQILIKTLNDFAYATNMFIIAEGIETIDELNTLIDLGVQYGQGYLLCKPKPEFEQLTEEIKRLILNRQKQNQKKLFYTTNSMPIGEIVRTDRAIHSETKGSEVNEIFSNNSSIFGVPVVDSGVPVGLIMRNNFYAHLATQYGVALFMNRPVRLLMNKHPLIVDYHTSLAQVSKIAIGRREEDLYDYIIITRDNQYYGVTTVKSLLEYSTQIELNKAKHSNPLTGLPGNNIIEQRCEKAIEDKEDCHFVYFDLDNFKAYNDVYGFENGDKILIFTAELLQDSINSFQWKNYFLGHVGGDDFLAVLSGSDIERFLNHVITKFDEKIKNHYTAKDQGNGYIISKNRHGIEEKFPFISISIAAVNGLLHEYADMSELGEVLSSIKKRCKLHWYSNYCIE